MVFSRVLQVSSTNKTDSHTEILLKSALNIITLTLFKSCRFYDDKCYYFRYPWIFKDNSRHRTFISQTHPRNGYACGLTKQTCHNGGMLWNRTCTRTTTRPTKTTRRTVGTTPDPTGAMFTTLSAWSGGQQSKSCDFMNTRSYDRSCYEYYLLVRKHMDEHERLSNSTLRHKMK